MSERTEKSNGEMIITMIRRPFSRLVYVLPRQPLVASHDTWHTLSGCGCEAPRQQHGGGEEKKFQLPHPGAEITKEKKEDSILNTNKKEAVLTVQDFSQKNLFKTFWIGESLLPLPSSSCLVRTREGLPSFCAQIPPPADCMHPVDIPVWLRFILCFFIWRTGTPPPPPS